MQGRKSPIFNKWLSSDVLKLVTSLTLELIEFNHALIAEVVGPKTVSSPIAKFTDLLGK